MRPSSGASSGCPQLATLDLSGAGVREVVPRGKHLLIRLADDRTLRTHFRMDGSWHIYRPGTKWRGGPAYDIRVVLATSDWECVGYRLHDVEIVPTADEGRLVGHLGPDVLGPDWDLDEALRRLREHPDEQIGVAILDQRNLAGIGNLYKVETLFLAGVHPWTRVADVPDLAALVERARTLMRANRHHPEQSTTGEHPPRRGPLGGRPQGPSLPPLRNRDPARGAGPGDAGTGDLVVPHVPGGALAHRSAGAHRRARPARSRSRLY